MGAIHVERRRERGPSQSTPGTLFYVLKPQRNGSNDNPQCWQVCNTTTQLKKILRNCKSVGLFGTLRSLVTAQQGVAGPWEQGLREEKGQRKGHSRTGIQRNRKTDRVA